MRDKLNRVVYLPSPGNLVLNVIFFAVVFILTISLGYFSDNIKTLTAPLSQTDSSFWATISILLLVSAGVYVLVIAKTRKYFICTRQCLSAALGATIVVILLYAVIWSLVQVAKGSQQFVVLRPQSWSLQGTLDNLKYGGALSLFSAAVSILGSAAISYQPEYDFTPFFNQWKRWKSPVKKLQGGSTLTKSEHDSLLDSTESMLKTLAAVSGYVQPVSLASARQLEEPLRKFDSWYKGQTEVSYKEARGLDEDIKPVVKRILRLC